MKPSWIRYSVIFDDIFSKKMSCNQSNHFFGTFFKISNGTRQKNTKLQTRPTGFEQRPHKPCACGHWRSSSKTNWFCAKAIHTQQKKNIPKIKMETNKTLSAFSHLWTQKPNHNLPQQPPNPVDSIHTSSTNRDCSWAGHIRVSSFPEKNCLRFVFFARHCLGKCRTALQSAIPRWKCHRIASLGYGERFT